MPKTLLIVTKHPKQQRKRARIKHKQKNLTIIAENINVQRWRCVENNPYQNQGSRCVKIEAEVREKERICDPVLPFSLYFLVRVCCCDYGSRWGANESAYRGMRNEYFASKGFQGLYSKGLWKARN